jgi:hypothetical protein
MPHEPRARLARRLPRAPLLPLLLLLLHAAAAHLHTRLSAYEEFALALFLGVDGDCDGRETSPCFWEAQPPLPVDDEATASSLPLPGINSTNAIDAQANSTNATQATVPSAAVALRAPRWRPAKPAQPEFRFHEYAVGEAPQGCLRDRWLYFVGDSVTRETMYALMTLNGAPPWNNFSRSEEVWRTDAPEHPDEDSEGYCKGWQTEHTTTDCVRDFHVGGVRYSFAFVGLLHDAEQRARLRSLLNFTAEDQPDTVLFNTGIWNMVLRRCELADYAKTLHTLLHTIRTSGYTGKLYWLGQTRPNWGVSCANATKDIQMRALGFLAPPEHGHSRIIPVDRAHLAGNWEHPTWWWHICLNATLCERNDPSALWRVVRDGLHPTLLVQTAIAQHILNLICT